MPGHEVENWLQAERELNIGREQKNGKPEAGERARMSTPASASHQHAQARTKPI